MALDALPLLREFILWIKYPPHQIASVLPTTVLSYTYIHVLEKPLLISPITNPIPKQEVRKMERGGGGAWGVWPRTRVLLRIQVSRSVNIDLVGNVEAIAEFRWR